MAVLDAESLTPTDVVWRRIRRDWRDDIVVIDKGEEGGFDWVEIGCSSRVACEQARISLASFVRNDREDWYSGWVFVEGAARPYRLRLVDPSLGGHEEAAA
jgi:hypothetical protein